MDEARSTKGVLKGNPLPHPCLSLLLRVPLFTYRGSQLLLLLPLLLPLLLLLLPSPPPFCSAKEST
jgi:hypothetical protein